MMRNNLIIGVLILTGALGANAAVLSESTTLASQGDVAGVFNISVYNRIGEYSGTDASGTFSGRIQDYAFYGSSTPSTLSEYASGSASLIGPTTATDVSGGGQDWAFVWETTDPVGFTTAQDYGAAGFGSMARAQGLSGSVDVSGIGAGTLYLMYGTFADANEVSATLSGSGQTDILVQSASVSGSGLTGQSGLWLTAFNFKTDGVYTDLAFTYTNADTDGSRARFLGAVITAPIPEPSTIGLLGIGVGILALNRKRRRRAD